MPQTISSTREPSAKNRRPYVGVNSNIEFVVDGDTVLRMGTASSSDLSGAGPVHPGEILQRDFLDPHGITANKLATRLNLPPNSVLAILHGTRGISGAMSILLGHAFGVSDDYFATLFSRYQVDLAAQQAERDRVAADRMARARALARELQIA